MIDSFEIRVPSVVETEGDFVVEVRALDVSGAIVVSDSTTVVQLIASDANIVFDADENGTYGEAGDDTKTLTNGIALFKARDTKSGTFVVDVSDGQSNLGSKEFLYSFNCLVLPYRSSEPPIPGTKNGPQFFSDRNSVATVTPVGDNQPERVTLLNSASKVEDLSVLLEEALAVTVKTIVQGTGTPVVTLPNENGSLEPTQALVASQATFNDNAIKGNPVLTFDGNDVYSLENPLSPILSETSNFTLETAVRLLQSGGVQTIFSQYLEAADNGKIALRYNNGFEIFLGSDGTLPDVTLSTTSQAINVPHHVIFERRGAVFTIRLNGTIVASITEGSLRTILQTGNLIGGRSSSGDFESNVTNFFPSDLLFLRAFNGTYSEAQRLLNFYEFEDDYGDPLGDATPYITSIQNTYDFDRIYPHDDPPSTGILRDVSGNGSNGQRRGVDVQQTPLLTDGGQSFEYGEGAFVEIPNFGLASSAGRTYHFWTATTEPAGSAAVDQYLFDHESPRIAIFWELANGGTTPNVGIFDTSYRSFGVSLPRTGVATLVSIVFSGTTAELYFNGVSQGTTTVGSNGRATLAGTAVVGGRFNGLESASALTYTQDAVMIINTAQAAGDILAIYNAGIA